MILIPLKHENMEGRRWPIVTFDNAAKASPVPHLDWETNIQAGIQAAQKALGISYEPVASSPGASRQ